MNPWLLSASWPQEPWRLWTGHLVHYDLHHALVNLLALAVPLGLTRPRGWLRLGGLLLGLAPLLSLALLPWLQGGTYGGASGLACAAWALVGLRRLRSGEGPAVGVLMLGLLGLKCVFEAVGGAMLAHEASWQTLPAAHVLGALLGLGTGLAERGWRISLPS